MASAVACCAARSTTSCPVLGGHLGDAGAHDPRTDDPHPLHHVAGHGVMLPTGRVEGKRAVRLTALRRAASHRHVHLLVAGTQRDADTVDA